MIEKFFLAFIPVFVAIDPIGLVAIFLGLGTSASPEQRKRQAVLGLFTALGIAVGFIFLGKIIFAALGITVADFQVAGAWSGRPRIAECWATGSRRRRRIRRRAAGHAVDRWAGIAHGATHFSRYRWPGLYAHVPLGESRAGCDRVLERRPIHALDGPTGITRRVQDNRAPSRSDRRQPDPAWLARHLTDADEANLRRKLYAPTASSVRIVSTSPHARLETCFYTRPAGDVPPCAGPELLQFRRFITTLVPPVELNFDGLDLILLRKGLAMINVCRHSFASLG